MALWSGKKSLKASKLYLVWKAPLQKEKTEYISSLPSFPQSRRYKVVWSTTTRLEASSPDLVEECCRRDWPHISKKQARPIIQSIEVAKSTLGKMTFHLVNRSALDALNGLVSLVSSTPTTAVKKNWEPQLTLCSSLHSIPIAIMYSRVAPVSVINQRRNAFLFQQKAEKTAIFNAVWRCFLW